MRNQFMLFIMIPLFFLVSSFSIGQNKLNHTIQPFYTPFILKAGDLSAQYTSYSHEFLGVEYTKPFIFESGINYVVSSNKFLWSLGFSFMNQQHTMWHTYPDPYGLYGEFDSDYPFYQYAGLYKITSNYFGINPKMGIKLSDKLRLNLGLNFYFSTTRESRINKYDFPNNYKKSGFAFNYELETPDGKKFVGIKTLTTPEGQKNKPIFLPEISLDYEVVPYLLLNLGFRCQFWKSPDNYRFKYTESGYIHATTIKNEALHESRITAQGYYFWLGVKYDISIFNRK